MVHKKISSFLPVSLYLVLSLCTNELLAAAPKNLRTSRLSSHGMLGQASSPQQNLSITPEGTPPAAVKQPIPAMETEITAQETEVKEITTAPVAPKKAAVTTPEKTEKIDAAAIINPVVKAPELQDKELQEEQHGVVFNFENADLQNLITYIADVFQVTFITDEAINPITQGGKAVAGNKITFKTQRPLSRQQAWNLFVTFLDMAGLSLFQEDNTNVYRITTVANVQKSPIPSFIGVDPSTLPDSDIKIRYIYFLENTSIDSIKGIVDALRSSTSIVTFLQELKAFMIVDSAYNIKSLMRVVKELDRVTMPQTMLAVRLKWVDAAQVKKLYESLATPAGQPAGAPRVFGPRKPSTAQYFPEDVQIIAEPRTNILILLGAKDAVDKIEQFISKYIDVEITAPYSPLHTYQLKYADATTVAAIMNNVTKFSQGTPAAQTGGVRGPDKYLKNMSFTAEPTGNRLIVRGEYDDFLKAKEILDQLDEAQPQIAIEILILTVDIMDNKTLGAQARNKWRLQNGQPVPSGANGLLGNNVSWQTSGLISNGVAQPVITNGTATTGAQRLLGDLVNLVTNSTAGSTILSLGTDPFGIWGIVQALQTITNLQVESNPFLIASNKTPAVVQLGNTRRVVTGIVKGATDTNTFSDDQANLTVNITPQINSDGMIYLDLEINIDEFTDPTNPTSGTKNTKKIKTSTIVADKEVLALGGLIKNRIADTLTKVPILGDIPIIGWLFKNKSKIETKSNLLVLISTRIIDPMVKEKVNVFTNNHIVDYKDDIKAMGQIVNERDLIDRTFFRESTTSRTMNNFLFKNDENFATRDAKDYKKLSYRDKMKQKRAKNRAELPIEKQPDTVLAKGAPGGFDRLSVNLADTKQADNHRAQAPQQQTQQIPQTQPVSKQLHIPPLPTAPTTVAKQMPKKSTKKSLLDFVADDKMDGAL